MYNKLLIKLQSKDLYVFRRRRKCLEISIVGFFFFFFWSLDYFIWLDSWIAQRTKNHDLEIVFPSNNSKKINSADTNRI